MTEAEARVISALLASGATTEHQRLVRTGLPRSTYHSARRKAYAEAWLRDRYVPVPGALGFPCATVAFARPYADRTFAVVDRWSQDPGCVLLWSSSQFALAVFFHANEDEARGLRNAAVPAELNAEPLFLAASSSVPGVPAYFDFEGAWTHLTGISGPVSYPQGLSGEHLGPREDGVRESSARVRWAGRELLTRPFAAESAGRAGHLIGPFGLPRSQRDLIESGQVVHRVFPTLRNLPAFRGRAIDQLVFVTGRFLGSAAPERLFASLTRDGGIRPFLYWVDSERALIGAVGQTQVPDASRSAPPGRPVLALLREALRDILVVQDRVENIREIVNHRYDRLADRLR